MLFGVLCAPVWDVLYNIKLWLGVNAANWIPAGRHGVFPHLFSMSILDIMGTRRSDYTASDT